MPKFILDVAVKSGSVNNARNELKKLQDGIKKTDKETKKLDRSISDTLKTLKQFGPRGVGIGAAFVGLSKILSESITQFAKFETGLITVQRIAGLTEGQVQSLGQSISLLSRSTGIATDDILKFAETGARFGLVGEELNDFTKTIARFAAVSGGVTEATQQQFAKLKSITDDTGVSFAGLANAVVVLGQSFPTTEAKITRTANRVAQDLAEFGVSTDFVLGLGTAIEATGLGAERASTAFGQVTRSLLKLQRATDEKSIRNFEDLSDAVNLTSESFRDLIIADPAQAIVELLDSGAPTALVLEKLGETGTRTAGSFATLSQNSDILRKALELSGREITDNEDLLAQYNKQLRTLEGQWNRATAVSSLFAREIGDNLAPAARGLLTVFNDLADLVIFGEIGFQDIDTGPTEEARRARENIARTQRQLQDLAEADTKAIQQRSQNFLQEQKILQDRYEQSVRETQKSIDRLRESETKIGRLRGLEGVERDLELVRIKYDALQDSFNQRFNLEFAQLPEDVSEEQLQAFGDRWNEFFNDLKGWYTEALEDAGQSGIDKLQDQLDGLRREYQDVVDRENQQRRDFNQPQGRNEAITSLIEAFQFDVEREELERQRAEERRQRAKDHAENRQDAAAIRAEIQETNAELKKANRNRAGVRGAAQ